MQQQAPSCTNISVHVEYQPILLNVHLSVSGFNIFIISLTTGIYFQCFS